MKKIFRFFCLSVVAAAAMQSCSIEDEYTYGKDLYTIDWNAAADSSTTTLVNRFWSVDRHIFTYVNDDWDFNTGTGYWPEAHAMDVIIDAYLRTGDAKYSAMFDQWYEGVKKCNWINTRGYRGEYIDDSAWIGLTMTRLYDATKDEKYKKTAIDLWEYMKENWDEEGGGVYWTTAHKGDKNSCTNGPAAILGARVYAYTQDAADLEWTKKIFDWEYSTMYVPATGAVYEGYNPTSQSAGGYFLTYNQGTFAGAAYELYKLTGEANYLNIARKACYFCISNPSCIDTGNNVLRDEGDGDGGLFKGIFMRYFTQIALEPNLDPVYKKKFATFLNNNAETAWRRAIVKKNDVQMLWGPNWATPLQGIITNVTSHTSGCTLIEARAYYESHK